MSMTIENPTNFLVWAVIRLFLNSKTFSPWWYSSIKCFCLWKAVWVKATWRNGIDCLIRLQPTFAMSCAHYELKGQIDKNINQKWYSHWMDLARNFKCCHSHCFMKLWLSTWNTRKFVLWVSQILSEVVKQQQMAVVFNFIKQWNRENLDDKSSDEMLEQIVTGDGFCMLHQSLDWTSMVLSCMVSYLKGKL